MSKLPPKFIRVHGKLYERREPVTADGSSQDVWAAIVLVSQTDSQYSPDAGEVMETEGQGSSVLEVMGVNREAVANEVTSRLRGKFRGQWNLNISKQLKRLPLEEARQYLQENYNQASEIMQDVMDGKVVVLSDETDAFDY